MQPLPLHPPRPRPECPEYPFVGQLQFQGLTIDVETRCGGVRSGVTPEGQTWRSTIVAHYGEIRGTRAVDGDAVDAFIGPDPHAPYAWVVQAKRPGSQTFDEPKCMLGFQTREDALQAFRRSYSAPGFVLGIVRWPVAALVDALRKPELQGGRLGKRALHATLRKGGALHVLMALGGPSHEDLEAAGQLGFVQVHAHTRKGKRVGAYVRLQRESIPEPAAPRHPPKPAEPDPAAPTDYLAELAAKPKELGFDGRYRARELAKALAEHSLPPITAKIVAHKAAQFLRYGYGGGAWSTAVAHAAKRIASTTKSSSLVHSTPGDELHGGVVSTMGELRAEIGRWEDFHRGEEHEHLAVFFTEPPLRGLFFYTTPEHTRAMLPSGDGRTTKAAAMVGAEASQWALATRSMIITHNHPSGGSLSTQDLTIASTLDLAEMRATSPDGGAWVIRRPSEGWPSPNDMQTASWLALQDVIRSTENEVERKWSEHADRAREYPPVFDRNWQSALAAGVWLSHPGLRVERVGPSPGGRSAAAPRRDDGGRPVPATIAAILKTGEPLRKGTYVEPGGSVFGGTPGRHQGEGARGGHVIGHTKSGRAVYGTPRAKPFEPGWEYHYQGWTPADHRDAAEAHRHAAETSWRSGERQRHEHLAGAHEYVAGWRERAAMMLKAEQLGLLSAPVRAHVRIRGGKVEQVKRHQRRRRVSRERFKELLDKEKLGVLTADENAALADHRQANRDSYEALIPARNRLRDMGIDLHKYDPDRQTWRIYELDRDGSEPDGIHAAHPELHAEHPDEQVAIVIDEHGDARLEVRPTKESDWTAYAPVPRTSNPRIEANLLARKIRREHGTLQQQARAKAETTPREVQRTRWGWTDEKTWAALSTRVRDYLGRYGPIRIDHQVTDLPGGRLRAEVTIRRQADKVELGRGTWIDETDGKEGALWQLPHGAAIHLPVGADPEHDDKTLFTDEWIIDWPGLDRPALTTPGPHKVMLRPRSYGQGHYVDHTLIAERLDGDETRRELTARQALEFAAQQAHERLDGIAGEPIPRQAWPWKPARGGVYTPDELSSVISEVRRNPPPEVLELTSRMRKWESGLRSEIGDALFNHLFAADGWRLGGQRDHSTIEEPTDWVGHWADHVKSEHTYAFSGYVEGTDAERRKAMQTPAFVQHRWDERWPVYRDRAERFMALTSNPELYKPTTPPSVILEHLAAPDSEHPRDSEAQNVAVRLLERRGYRFGLRENLPEAYDAVTPGGWERYQRAIEEKRGPRAALVLTAPGQEHTRSATGPEAIEAYHRARAALQQLGDEPWKRLVSKGRFGWTLVDPVSREAAWGRYRTRAEAREHAKAWLEKHMQELGKAAGSAAEVGAA